MTNTQPLPMGNKLEAVQMRRIKGGWEDPLYPSCNDTFSCGSVNDCHYYATICSGTPPIDAYCIRNNCIFEF